MDYSLLMAIRKVGDGGEEVRTATDSNGHFDIQRSATHSQRCLDENHTKIRAKYLGSVKSNTPPNKEKDFAINRDDNESPSIKQPEPLSGHMFIS